MTTANDTSSALERLELYRLGQYGRRHRAASSARRLSADGSRSRRRKDAGAEKNGACCRGDAEGNCRAIDDCPAASLQPGDVEKVTCGENGIAAANNEKLVFVDLSSTAPELAIKVIRLPARAWHRDARCAAERARISAPPTAT